MRTRIPLYAAAAFALAAFSAPVTPVLLAARSAQAEEVRELNAAAVVIDTGTEVRKVCVRFPEPEISGEELLRRAKVDAVFAEYSIGMAVCSLCGVGCPADDCFCESTTSGRYWNYSRSGGSGWQRSNLGASSTTVKDGDIDGWAWGTEGAVPPWIGFESICVEVEPSATPSSSTSGASGASPRPAASAGAAPSRPQAQRPQDGDANAPAEAEGTTDSAVPEAESTREAITASEPVSSADVGEGGATDGPSDGDGLAADEAASEDAEAAVLSVDTDAVGGSGMAGLLGFAGAAAALGAGLFAARRRLG